MKTKLSANRVSKAKETDVTSALKPEVTAMLQAPPGSGLLLKPEVAAMLRITPRTVEQWMRDGIIPYMKFGRGRRGTVRFNRADIEASLKANFGRGGFQ